MNVLGGEWIEAGWVCFLDFGYYWYMGFIKAGRLKYRGILKFVCPGAVSSSCFLVTCIRQYLPDRRIERS